jgi:hypothetical protein
MIGVEIVVWKVYDFAKISLNAILAKVHLASNEGLWIDN